MEIESTFALVQMALENTIPKMKGGLRPNIERYNTLQSFCDTIDEIVDTSGGGAVGVSVDKKTGVMTVRFCMEELLCEHADTHPFFSLLPCTKSVKFTDADEGRVCVEFKIDDLFITEVSE